MRLGLTTAFLLRAFCVYNGFREGPSLLGAALNIRQQGVAIGQVAYAVFALLALEGWWRRRGRLFVGAVCITGACSGAEPEVGAIALRRP